MTRPPTQPSSGDVAPAPEADALTRATRVAVQTWEASVQRLLPLLTPLGEKAWAVGWEPVVRWQAPGAGEGTLFVTHSAELGDTVWVLERFDAEAFRVAYVRVSPGALVVEIRVALTPLTESTTRAEVRYTFTALSARGNAHLSGMTEARFADFMRAWERELNHFLRTGQKLLPSPAS